MSVPASFGRTKDSFLFLGRDVAGEELWSTSSMVKTHMFVSGSTGSGKTEFLTNLMANVAAWGSGGVFIDGKGDLAFFSKMHAIMTAMGREEDLLLVNLSPASSARKGRKHSHTINPFAILTADEISLIMTGMLGRFHDPMWTGRAISLMNAIIYALTYLRDVHGEPMTIGKIRSHLGFRNLYRLYERMQKIPDADPSAKEELVLYFETLPGFLPEKGVKQGMTTLEQHGYLSMQWTRPVGLLATGYGHILNAEVPDIDIRDVVLNRRVLVILLPSLDRSSDDVRQIGSLLVGMLKSMLGQALRSPVEGTWGEVVRRRITNATHPFVMVMDEVAQYVTDGMGMMAQQARSLNVGLVFATQDFDSLHTANPRETEAIMANTNIKVFMKAENPSSSQIRNVLATFVEKRRFEKSKFGEVLRAKKDATTHHLTFEPKVIARSQEFVEVGHNKENKERLYALDAEGLDYYENQEPEDLALMLRGFGPGDMMVTYGSDLAVGRAGYVALDHGRGMEHEIRLQRMVHIAGYGQRLGEARKARDEVNAVLDAMRKGVFALSSDESTLMLTSRQHSSIDPRLAEADNFDILWSELLFDRIKGQFPDDVFMLSSNLQKRRRIATDHEDALHIPTRLPPPGRKETPPEKYDIMKLFEDAA